MLLVTPSVEQRGSHFIMAAGSAGKLGFSILKSSGNVSLSTGIFVLNPQN